MLPMTTPPSAPPSSKRVKALSDFPELAARAAEMLRSTAVMLPLTEEEARLIVSQMGLARFADGTVVIREGESEHTDHLLLLLEGQMAVQVGAAGNADGLALSVLGPGSVVGEVSLFDGGLRSATCTAIGTVTAAGLSRRGLDRLIMTQPQVASRLMLGLAQRLADRVRALSDQLQLYAQMADAHRAGAGRLRGDA
jgi:CRP-like cAMP-binding protein